MSGTISQIDGATLTVDVQQEGQVKVNVGADTLIQKTVAGSTADIQAGLFISATGSADASGNFVADHISIRQQTAGNRSFTPPTGTIPGNGDRPGRPTDAPLGGTDPSPSNGVFGTVVSFSNGTITLSTAQSQDISIAIASDCIIQKTVEAATSDFQTGDFITVTGPSDQNGIITASLVTISPGALPGFP